MRLAVRFTTILSAGAFAAVALTTTGNAQTAGQVSEGRDTAAVAAASASTAAASAKAEDSHDTDTVYVVGKAKDGKTTVTIYDPAKGVTPDQLRDTLRKTGKTVLGKGQQPPTAQPGQQPSKLLACLSYGTARQWCDHQWSYGGYADPQIYFLDHTSAAWPVTSAVTTWHQAVGIDSYYRWYTQGCPGGGTHCVHVYNGAYGATGWLGQTSWSPGTQGPVTVKLNDSYSLTANERRTIACHELGHALALNHNTATSSCLYSGTYISLTPNSNDYTLLSQIYP